MARWDGTAWQLSSDPVESCLLHDGLPVDFADPEVRISEIIDGNYIALRATDDQEHAVHVFQEYDRVAFPVTDSRGVLLGIVIPSVIVVVRCIVVVVFIGLVVA